MVCGYGYEYMCILFSMWGGGGGGVFFFFKQKTAYEIGVRLVGSEMCIRDRVCRLTGSIFVVGSVDTTGPQLAARMQELYEQMPHECITTTGMMHRVQSVSYTHLRAHETDSYLVCRLLLEKKKRILSLIQI